MTKYCMPLFLEDRTGLLTGSDFVDIHDRLSLALKRTARDSTHKAYTIYEILAPYRSTPPPPLAVLDFGSNNSLGTVSFPPDGRQLSMKEYLYKPASLSSSKVRTFIASDGQYYQWCWCVRNDQEWSCTNSSGFLVAYYSLKDPQEPRYTSSGCMLTVDESYSHLAAELLASLMIMRHIAAYGL